MPTRFKFTKDKLDSLPTPDAGKRVAYWDTQVPKLAARITHAGTVSFYVVKRVGAKVEWVSLGGYPELTPEQARTAAQTRLGEFAGGANPAAAKRAEKLQQTLGEAYEAYRDNAELRERNTDDLRALWERFLGPLPDAPAKKHGRKRTKHEAGVNWSARRLDAITKGEVRALHAAIGKTNKYAANRAIELGSAIYNYATSGNYRGDNPFSDVTPFKEAKRRRFIRAEEMPRFFAALADDSSQDFKDYVLLSLLTGQRRNNVLAMQWEELDLGGATWTIPDEKAKADEQIHVALVPEAVEALKKRKPRAAGYVFPAESKAGHMTPPKKRWAALLKRAKIADFRIHDLRRSLGSWQAISGASLLIIGKSLGHKSPSATAIYAQLQLDPVRQSVNTATSKMLEQAGLKKPARVVKLKKK